MPELEVLLKSDLVYYSVIAACLLTAIYLKIRTVLEDKALLIPPRMDVPAIGSVWRHKNGTLYRVILITNELSQRFDEYPITVSYENLHPLPNGVHGKWSRFLHRWHESMTLVEEPKITKQPRVNLDPEHEAAFRLPITEWSATDYSILVNNQLGYVSDDMQHFLFDTEEEMNRFKKLAGWK